MELFGDNCIYLLSLEYVPGITLCLHIHTWRAHLQRGLELARRLLTLQVKGRDQSAESPGPAHELERGAGPDFREAAGRTLGCAQWGRELMALQEITERTCAERAPGTPAPGRPCACRGPLLCVLRSGPAHLQSTPQEHHDADMMVPGSPLWPPLQSPSQRTLAKPHQVSGK